jgi:apolipoprotein N-acyltransferase
MTTEQQPDQRTNELRPEVRKIISSGKRPTVVRSGSRLSVSILTSLSLIFLWLSFTPVELSPVAWIALIPISQLLRLRTLPRFSGLLIWGLSFLWATATLQWMRLGHPTMFLALAALAAYVGLYIPTFIWLGRRSLMAGLPLWISVPVVWTGLEYARAYLLTGFSWYYLGHSQYRWLSLIQISDIVGAYGVSFLIALISGALAQQIPLAWLRRWKLDVEESATDTFSLKPLIVSALLLIGVLTYGTFRKTPPEQFPPGPAMALIQGNFTPELKHDRNEFLTRFRVHDALTAHSVSLQPDVIVWPETMFSWAEKSAAEGVTDEDILSQIPVEELSYYGNQAGVLVEPFRTREVQQRLEEFSQSYGAAIIMGLEANVAEKHDLKTYNAAAFVRPDLGYSGRYDKIHRVIFGEYIPLRSVFPWLSDLTPFGANFGIDAGAEMKMFEYAGFRIVPMICFEDTVPHLTRRMAAQRDSEGRECDVLVNLTNDAWFRGSSELDQHLITGVFRSVETRVPLVRCVNGGISAFIDGNGLVREPDKILVMKEPLEGLHADVSEVKGMRDPSTGAWRRQFNGIIFGQVPLDPRSSLYVQYGDWFAGLCLFAMLAVCVTSFMSKK